MTNAPLADAQGSASASQPTLMNVPILPAESPESSTSAPPRRPLPNRSLTAASKLSWYRWPRRRSQMVRKDGGRDGEEAVRQTQRLR